MAWARITPGDPLVVHPRRGRCAVVELGGDPRYPLATCTSSHSRFTSKACRWSATNWKRLTSSSPRRNTSPPGAGCPARSRAWRSRSPTPLPVPATAPARPPPIRPAPLVVPRSLGRRTTGSTDQGPARAPTPAACAGRFPSPPRSLAASHPESTDTGQQPGGGTPPCSSYGPRLWIISLPRPWPDSACPRSRVKSRVPTTSVSASVLSRVGAAFAAMTAPGPAHVGLGSVCPLIIGPRHNEAGIG